MIPRTPPRLISPCVLITTLALYFSAPANAQWEIQSAPTTADLRGIDNVGKGIAWASGTAGTVLRTTDDGKTWQRCATPPDADHLDFRGIQAFDAQTAIVMSSGKGPLSRLYKTTNACQTWTLLFTNPDPEGFFDDALELLGGPVIILGDAVNGSMTIWYGNTRDGADWTRDKQPGLEISPDVEAFAASNSGLMIVEPSAVAAFVTGGLRPTFFWRPALPTNQPNSWHGSNSWSTAAIPLAKGPTAGAFSMGHARDFEFTSPGFTSLYTKMVIVGGDYQKPEGRSGTAAFTLDGGKTWLPAATPPQGYRSAVAYDAATKTWITVGPNGTDISTDDGRNWRALKPAANEPTDADQHWNALSLPFVVGPHGRIGRLKGAP
jgi:photosystem II stability/assembly factor-like uncharacterized protein